MYYYYIIIYIHIIIGWKYTISCIVCEENSPPYYFENNACLKKHR